MPGNILSDTWEGWVGFWKELYGPKPGSRATTTKQTRVLQTPKIPEQREQRAMDPKKKPPLSQKPRKRGNKEEIAEEAELAEAVDPPAPFPSVLEEHLETPAERIMRMEAREKRKRTDHRSKLRRQLLWINPGTDLVEMAHKSFLTGASLPNWAVPLQESLRFDQKRLYFEGLPMLTKEEKRAIVKTEYFDPKGFSTIRPIFHKFCDTYANLTRGDVTRILRSLETYQLNFRRMKPPKIMSRMNLKHPGVIMCDMFFPSKNLGWRSDLAGCLTVMDAWSRFVRVYAMESKRKKTVQKGIERFLREFASKGHIPKVMLCDKGGELRGAYEAMERYRRKPGQMVFHSQTGKPVNLVEQTQAQIQRRMAVFRTSGITDDYSTILEDICDSINNQKRPDRGDKTPLELLSLDKEGRMLVNAKSNFGVASPDERFKDLVVGNHVRVLMMTLKEQMTGKKKGFQEKWSRDIFRVKRKAALQGNPGAYRYFLTGDDLSYFRHELLRVVKDTDTAVLDLVKHREAVIGDEEWSGFD